MAPAELVTRELADDQHDGRVVAHRLDGGGIDGDLGDHLRLLRDLDEVVRLVLEVVPELAGRVVDDALYVLLRLVEVQRHQCHDALPSRCGVLRAALLIGGLVAVVQHHEHAQRDQCGRAGDSEGSRKVFRIRAARHRRRVADGFGVRRLLGDIFFVTVFGVRAGLVDLGRLGRCGYDVGRFGVDFGRFGDSVPAAPASVSTSAAVFHLSRRVAFSGLGLPAQPDRAGPGARGGSNRLRLGRLGLRLLREGQCVGRVSRLARILRRFIDAISVDHRRAAPERRHSDLLVC